VLHGKAAASGINNWEVFKAHIDGKRKVQANLEQIAEIAQAMRGSLEKGGLERDGPSDARGVGLPQRRTCRRFLPTPLTAFSRLREKRERSLEKCAARAEGGCVVMLIEPGSARSRREGSRGRRGQILPMRIDRSGVQVTVLES